MRECKSRRSHATSLLNGKVIARAPKDELRGDMKTSGDLLVCGRYALNIILRAKFP